jgi:hypothetical protein
MQASARAIAIAGVTGLTVAAQRGERATPTQIVHQAPNANSREVRNGGSGKP